jgi:hypothetical protein
MDEPALISVESVLFYDQNYRSIQFPCNLLKYEAHIVKDIPGRDSGKFLLYPFNVAMLNW